MQTTTSGTDRVCGAALCAACLLGIGLVIHLKVIPMHLDEEYRLGVALIGAAVLTSVAIVALLVRPTRQVMTMVAGFAIAMTAAYFWVHNSGRMSSVLVLPRGIKHENQEVMGLWCVVTQVLATTLLLWHVRRPRIRIRTAVA